MEIVVLILGILAILALSWVGIIGLGIFGITRLVQSITGLLSGRNKEDKRMGGAPAQKRVGDGAKKDYSNSTNGNTAGVGQTNRNSSHNQPVPTPRVHKTYEYFDVDAGATSQRIIQVMRDYEQDRVVGIYASEVVSALSMTELKRRSIFSEIDSKFSRSSISWDHFAAPTTEACDTLLRNCALLANRVQAFDVDDYERMERFYTTGGEMRNGVQDPSRIKRWELLRHTKDQMDELRSANEALLLELNKLSSALSAMSSTESADDTTRIAQEVARLAEETKYYR